MSPMCWLTQAWSPRGDAERVLELAADGEHAATAPGTPPGRARSRGRDGSAGGDRLSPGPPSRRTGRGSGGRGCSSASHSGPRRSMASSSSVVIGAPPTLPLVITSGGMGAPVRAVLTLEQEVVEGRVGQHHPDERVAGCHQRGQRTVGSRLQQHDRTGGGAQQTRLRRRRCGPGRRPRRGRAPSRRRACRAGACGAQGGNRGIVRCVADEVEPAEPLHRDGPPGPQLAPRGDSTGPDPLRRRRDAIDDGGETEPRSAVMTRDRLGVVPPSAGSWYSARTGRTSRTPPSWCSGGRTADPG